MLGTLWSLANATAFLVAFGDVVRVRERLGPCPLEHRDGQGDADADAGGEAAEGQAEVVHGDPCPQMYSRLNLSQPAPRPYC